MTETLEALIVLHSEASATGRPVCPDHVADLCGFLDRAEVIDLARRCGCVRTLTTRTDALAAVVRWVNEVPRAREAIAI